SAGDTSSGRSSSTPTATRGPRPDCSSNPSPVPKRRPASHTKLRARVRTMSDSTPKAPRSGFFAKVKRGLFMTHTEILEQLGTAVRKGLGSDETVLESLEEALIAADVGADTAAALTGAVRARTAATERTDLEGLRALLVEEIERLISETPRPAAPPRVPLEVV